MCMARLPVKIGTKGRITVPRSLRNNWKLSKKDKIWVIIAVDQFGGIEEPARYLLQIDEGGRVTIPELFRNKYKIEDGTELWVEYIKE